MSAEPLRRTVRCLPGRERYAVLSIDTLSFLVLTHASRWPQVRNSSGTLFVKSLAWRAAWTVTTPGMRAARRHGNVGVGPAELPNGDVKGLADLHGYNHSVTRGSMRVFSTT